MARFWFYSDEARRRITALLKDIPEGRILPDEELAALGCDFDGQQYGELEAAQWLAAGAPEGDPRPPITIERFGRPTFVHLSADGTSSATEEIGSTPTE